MILTTMPATNVRTARRGDGGLHPGTASQMTIQAGAGQTAVAGTAVAIAPAVLVRDQLNQPVAQALVQFAVTGGSTASELVADLFTRANENPLAGNWTKVGGAATNLQLLSNAIQGVTASGEGMMYYNAVTWPADQYAECRITLSPGSGGGGPAVRLSSTAQTGYIAQVAINATVIGLAKFVAGTYTQLQTIPISLIATDTVRLEARGSTLRVLKNGVQVGSDTIDGSITTGNAGLDLFDTSGYVLDNWAGGLPPTTSGSIAPSTPMQTDSAGVATATAWTLGTVPGTNTLTVTGAGLVGSPVTLTATGTSGAGQATQIAINAGNNQTGSAGVPVAIAPSVIVRDASNMPVAGVLVTFAVVSGGGSLTGATQSTNASGIATVGSWTLGATAGTNTLTAASAGLTGSPLTFTATGTIAAIGLPDPTQLPVATVAQAPDVTAYAALSVPGQAPGFSYLDPVTGVRIWKVTDATTPVANTTANHDYGEGGFEVSRGWGANNASHTILIRLSPGSPHQLVDFTRGVGFTNYRALTGTLAPKHELCFSFSAVAGQERIAYVLNGSNQLIRIDTASMTVANTGFFGITIGGDPNWLQQDYQDVWFVGLQTATTAFAFNSLTGALLTHTESWLNEPRLERNGNFVVLTATSSDGNGRYWELPTNTFGATQSLVDFAHGASLRGRWVTVNTHPSAPPPLDRYQIAGGTITRTAALVANSGGYSTNNSGCWVQSDDASQWAYISGTDTAQAWQSLLLIDRGIGLVRADGSDFRLLCHHYANNPSSNYYDLVWGKPSPDGRVAIFNSNMNVNGGRTDLFVAEVPLSLSHTFYVAPSGATTNTGSIASPWNLAYAFAGAGGTIQPGDTISLRAGTYTGDFTVNNVVGSANSRIVFQNFLGERAIIDRSVQVNANCFYVDFRSATQGWLEIMNSSAAATHPIGWFNFGSFCSLINVAIHDGGQSGIFQSSQGTGGMVYGCFLYNNGLNDNLDHGIYTQNSNGTKYIHENVIANNYAFGIHCYGSVANILRGLDLRGNACATNGSISARNPPVVINLLLGGGTAVSRGVVRENHCFYPLSMTASGNFWMGFEAAGTNNDLDCQDNWIAGGFPAARFWQWHQASTVSGNLIATQSQVLNSQGTTTAITWSHNTHYRLGTTSSWVHNASTTTFGGWRTASGVGASDTASGGDPTGTWVRVRPNSFESGRGNVIVYNWAGASTVTADVSTVLNVGDTYNVYNTENLFGSAVTSGILLGSVLTFPMSVVTPPAPLATTPNVGVSSGPTYQVFLVRRS